MSWWNPKDWAGGLLDWFGPGDIDFPSKKELAQAALVAGVGVIAGLTALTYLQRLALHYADDHAASRGFPLTEVIKK